ncbi:hypothetical protein TNCT_729801 [Trichonephila clavata]|uniref:Uncharacterized protein n=1 Tax=Trichonephila clavata TaxID=2740835 RepID=A0A8X6F139_TRICU|nr:hypothetical protein TNCT_729801 [Trichonephila clavata]
MLTQTRRAGVLNWEEARAQHDLVTGIVEGRVKLSTDHDLSFILIRRFSCKIDIRWTTKTDLSFSRFLKRFKRTTRKSDLRVPRTVVFRSD